MPKQGLQEIIGQVRTEPIQARYSVVKAYFSEHEEDLTGGATISESVDALISLCKLPYAERRFLTYPIVGNFALKQISEFNPQTEHQKAVYEMVRKWALEGRFKNSHLEEFYEGPVEFTKIEDDLYNLVMSNPDDSRPLAEFMEEKYRKFYEALRVKKEYLDSGRLGGDKKITFNHGLKTDLGHGLCSPLQYFLELLSYIAPFYLGKEIKPLQPLELTIMVVDDENPEHWYKRLLAAGFQEPEHQGFFYDCKSALEALKKGSYDVILSDLEFGEEKMDGIEFAEAAYRIQRRKRKKPLIAVFSYSHERLKQAEEELFPHFPSVRRKQKVFCQPIELNKMYFTAHSFRINVEHASRR